MENYLSAIAKRISPGLHKIFKNFSWLLAEKILNMAIALTVGIYTIRYLGAKEFGMLSYTFSIVNLFDNVSRLGLDGIVIRNLVIDEKIDNEFLGSAFILKLIASLVSIAVCILGFTSWSDNQVNNLLIILIAISMIFNIFDVIDFWFQSKMLSRPMVMVRGIQVIISSILKLIFIYFHLSVFAFAALFSVEGLIRMVGMIFFYHQEKRSLKNWKFEMGTAKNLLKDSFPLILSSLMVVIYIRIDQIMLGIMTTEKAVGLYAAAIRFSEIWYFIPVIICASVFPTILKAKSHSQTLYFQRLQQLYDLLMWMALIVVLLVSLSSYPLVNFLLGKAYQESATILILHIWAFPFVCLGVARGQWLIAENYTHFNFFATALGAISNILLNLILIPPYQGIGAAIATVISYALSAYLSCLLYRPSYEMFKMLSKALVIPLRVEQNLYYWSQISTIIQRKK